MFTFKIQTYDTGLGREETAMLITLHDYERRPLAEPGVDIRVEVTNPAGKKTRAPVVDMTDTEGSYKVLFQVTVGALDSQDRISRRILNTKRCAVGY